MDQIPDVYILFKHLASSILIEIFLDLHHPICKILLLDFSIHNFPSPPMLQPANLQITALIPVNPTTPSLSRSAQISVINLQQKIHIDQSENQCNSVLRTKESKQCRGKEIMIAESRKRKSQFFSYVIQVPNLLILFQQNACTLYLYTMSKCS